MVIKTFKDYLLLSSRKFATVKIGTRLIYKTDSLILMRSFKGERKKGLRYKKYFIPQE